MLSQRKPLRLMKIITLSAYLSTWGFPCDNGKKGFECAICAPVNHNRSLMSPLCLRASDHAESRRSIHHDPENPIPLH